MFSLQTILYHMFLLYTQQVVQADATGVFILVLIISAFVIPRVVKKASISAAEDLKERYPEGFRKVCGYSSYIDYERAKKINDKRSEIINAQLIFDREKKEAEEKQRIRNKIAELRRTCPYATKDKTDDYIANNEGTIRQIEQKHRELEGKAKQIINDSPLGAKALYPLLSSWSMSDDEIDKIIENETIIRDKQKECEANNAELKRLEPQFRDLKRNFPLGITAICTERKWSTSNAEHVKLLLSMSQELADKQQEREEKFLKNKDKLDYVVKRAKETIAKSSKLFAKGDISRSYGKRIAERVMEIIEAEEEFKTFSKHLDDIAKTQNAFALETRNIIPNFFNGWGWYKYSFDMTYLDDFTMNTKSNTLSVWQAFCEACCFDDTVSYEFYPRYKQNRIFKSQLEGTYSYNSSTWDKVFSFILNLKDKYEDELFVVFANTDHLDENAFVNNYGYIEGKLNNAGIRCGETILTETSDAVNRKYIVLDIITENSELIKYCSSIFHYRHISQFRNSQGTTGVVFITMLKCYDGAEVNDLNNKKIKEREDKARKEREEEERRQQEQRDIFEAKSIASSYPIGFNRFFPNVSSYSINATQAKSIIEKKSAIREYEDTLSRLKNSVATWDSVRGVPHYFFYYYYPTRFTNISFDSQEARRLVYNFKDGVAHSKVKDLVVGKIRSTFSSNDLSKMCFTCIPASTRSVNQSRYKDFSSEVCRALGMSNAYDHISITKEKTPSHLGGDDQAEYSYDGSFFSGKFVILFDDIVTRGGSVSSMKAELEAIGATVICAISIGRTYSDWNGNTPKPHPYTGRI